MPSQLVNDAAAGVIDSLLPRLKTISRGVARSAASLMLMLFAGALGVLIVVGFMAAVALELSFEIGWTWSIIAACGVPLVMLLIVLLIAKHQFRTAWTIFESTPAVSSNEQDAVKAQDEKPASPTEQLVKLASDHPAVSASAIFAALGMLGPGRLFRLASKGIAALSLISMAFRSAKANPVAKQI